MDTFREDIRTFILEIMEIYQRKYQGEISREDNELNF